METFWNRVVGNPILGNWGSVWRQTLNHDILGRTRWVSDRVDLRSNNSSSFWDTKWDSCNRLIRPTRMAEWSKSSYSSCLIHIGLKLEDSGQTCDKICPSICNWNEKTRIRIYKLFSKYWLWLKLFPNICLKLSMFSVLRICICLDNIEEGQVLLLFWFSRSCFFSSKLFDRSSIM